MHLFCLAFLKYQKNDASILFYAWLVYQILFSKSLLPTLFMIQMDEEAFICEITYKILHFAIIDDRQDALYFSDSSPLLLLLNRLH